MSAARCVCAIFSLFLVPCRKTGLDTRLAPQVGRLKSIALLFGSGSGTTDPRVTATAARNLNLRLSGMTQMPPIAPPLFISFSALPLFLFLLVPPKTRIILRGARREIMGELASGAQEAPESISNIKPFINSQRCIHHLGWPVVT